MKGWWGGAGGLGGEMGRRTVEGREMVVVGLGWVQVGEHVGRYFRQKTSG